MGQCNFNYRGISVKKQMNASPEKHHNKAPFKNTFLQSGKVYKKQSQSNSLMLFEKIGTLINILFSVRSVYTTPLTVR